MKAREIAGALMLTGLLITACSGEAAPQETNRAPSTPVCSAPEGPASDATDSRKEPAAQAIVYKAGIEGMG